MDTSQETSGQLGEIINRLEDPIFLVDEQMLILFRNAAAQRVLKAKAGLGVRLGRLTFSTPNGVDQLASLVAGLAAIRSLRSPDVKTNTSRGLKVPRQAASRDWLVMISALPASHVPAFLVHLVSRVHPRQVPAVALQDLFGLTRKETEVLSRLMRNDSLSDIAERMILSRETIRAYVKRIFRKCDVRSRIELLAMLQKISLLASLSQ